MQKSQLIKLASGYHPHGIKGDIELKLLNDDPNESVLDDGMKVWLFPASEKSKLAKNGEEWTITKLRFGNKVICTLEGMKDRTHLETLIPFDLYLDRSLFPETEDDQVYLVDLVGVTTVSPEGDELGVIESFDDNGMQYIFNVRMKSGELLSLPYVDQFFPEIDMDSKKITMILPEYTE